MPEAAIAQLTESKKVQQTIQFTAPQTGFVDNLNIREGFYVQPGTTMMSIGALDEVWVEAQVFEREAGLIKVGLAVSMRMDYLPGKVWQGVIDYVYPSLDESTRTLKVRLRFDNPEYLLKPNMFAQVLIENDDEKARLVVPREAVIRTGSQNRVVLALGEGRFKSVEVELGVMSSDAIELLSGIEEGDEVVTSAQFLLDSESSISSDFMRMSASSDDEKMSESMHGQHDEALAPVWVSASIEDVMSDKRMVRMAHEAIEEWGMMAMTMNFTVAEEVDFSALTVGTQLHAQITKTDAGPYQIIGVHIMSADKGMDP
jgi:Cu(I)/Ag(I) efflux system membrane fusion protein